MPGWASTLQGRRSHKVPARKQAIEQPATQGTRKRNVLTYRMRTFYAYVLKVSPQYLMKGGTFQFPGHDTNENSLRRMGCHAQATRLNSLPHIRNTMGIQNDTGHAMQAQGVLVWA